jgi:NADH:ubiquinone oxidoreductase subunit K
MMFAYFLAFGFALFAVGVAGVAASRHFIIMMLGVEVALSAAIVVAAASFAYSGAAGNVLGLLFTLWAVASAEIMGMVAVYRYMLAHGISMDIRELSKLRDR